MTAQESTGTARGYGATLRAEGDNDDEFGFISLVRVPRPAVHEVAVAVSLVQLSCGQWDVCNTTVFPWACNILQCRSCSMSLLGA